MWQAGWGLPRLLLCRQLLQHKQVQHQWPGKSGVSSAAAASGVLAKPDLTLSTQTCVSSSCKIVMSQDRGPDVISELVEWLGHLRSEQVQWMVTLFQQRQCQCCFWYVG